MTDIEDIPIKPCVAQYNSITLSNLTPGTLKYWCTCGLSKSQPWCDQSHKGTGFKPLPWRVPTESQSLFTLCACKYTSSPPYCDGSHIHLPLKILEQQKNCSMDHSNIIFCEKCGFCKEKV